MVEAEGVNELARLREMAEQAVDPCVTNSVVVAAFWEEAGGEIDPQAGYEAIRAQVQAVRKGVLSGAEATLVGQAAALNVIFAEMARRGQAALNRPGIAAERYLRLAMRAQAQCRMTLNELRDLTDRPSKQSAEETPIREIRRIIVRPGDDIANMEAGLVAERDEDWPTRNDRREDYGRGERLDGGAARRLFADDEGAQGVGAFDGAAYG